MSAIQTRREADLQLLRDLIGTLEESLDIAEQIATLEPGNRIILNASKSQAARLEIARGRELCRRARQRFLD